MNKTTISEFLIKLLNDDEAILYRGREIGLSSTYFILEQEVKIGKEINYFYKRFPLCNIKYIEHNGWTFKGAK